MIFSLRDVGVILGALVVVAFAIMCAIPMSQHQYKIITAYWGL